MIIEVHLPKQHRIKVLFLNTHHFRMREIRTTLSNRFSTSFTFRIYMLFICNVVMLYHVFNVSINDVSSVAST